MSHGKEGAICGAAIDRSNKERHGISTTASFENGVWDDVLSIEKC